MEEQPHSKGHQTARSGEKPAARSKDAQPGARGENAN